MQCDQKKIITCIICRQFWFCFPRGNPRVTNAWANAKVASASQSDRRLLPTIGARLVWSAADDRRCREIERESGNKAVILRAPARGYRASLPHPERWGCLCPAPDPKPPARTVERQFWHAKCFGTGGRSWPGTMWGNPSFRFPTLEIINREAQ